MIDKERIKFLRFNKHMSYGAIAKELGCTRQYVAYIVLEKRERMTKEEREKNRLYQERYRRKNREKILKQSKEWYQRHKKRKIKNEK